MSTGRVVTLQDLQQRQQTTHNTGTTNLLRLQPLNQGGHDTGQMQAVQTLTATFINVAQSRARTNGTANEQETLVQLGNLPNRVFGDLRPPQGNVEGNLRPLFRRSRINRLTQWRTSGVVPPESGEVTVPVGPQEAENGVVVVPPQARVRCLGYFRQRFQRAWAFLRSPEGRRCCCDSILRLSQCIVNTILLVRGDHNVTIQTFSLEFVSKPDEEVSPDAVIMQTLNNEFREAGFQMTHKIVQKDIQDTIKEMFDWAMMTEKEFWAKCCPKDIEGDPLSYENIAYQIATLDALAIMCLPSKSLNPVWTWVMPNDGAVLALQLAEYYQVKGPEAMYNFMAGYLYYNKTKLPRTVAIDVIISALSGLYVPPNEVPPQEEVEVKDGFRFT